MEPKRDAEALLKENPWLEGSPLDPAGQIVDAIREGRRVRDETKASYAPSRPCETCGEPLAAWAKVCHACEKRAAAEMEQRCSHGRTQDESCEGCRQDEALIDPITHYPDGSPRDWVTTELRAADYRTLSQLAETWRCDRGNVLGVLCRAVRMQVWPLGDVLTNYPEFQSWVERIVMAEQAPFAEAFRRPTEEEQAAVEQAFPHPFRRRRRAAAAASEELFCRQCQHLREGASMDRADGLCEECGEEADA